VNHLFGFKFKVITGYEKHAEDSPRDGKRRDPGQWRQQLVDAKALNANWIAEKKVRPIAQWALRKASRARRRSDGPRPRQERSRPPGLLLALAGSNSAAPSSCRPNVPADRVEALRRAFDATMKDPQFLADAQRLQLDIDPLTGEQVAALVEQVARTSPDTAARVRAAMENR